MLVLVSGTTTEASVTIAEIETVAIAEITADQDLEIAIDVRINKKTIDLLTNLLYDFRPQPLVEKPSSNLLVGINLRYPQKISKKYP